MRTKPQYLVQRATDIHKMYGQAHLSDDAETTLCGQDIDEKFLILANEGNYTADGPICKFCLAELGKAIIQAK